MGFICKVLSNVDFLVFGSLWVPTENCLYCEESLSLSVKNVGTCVSKEGHQSCEHKPEGKWLGELG